MYSRFLNFYSAIFSASFFCSGKANKKNSIEPSFARFKFTNNNLLSIFIYEIRKPEIEHAVSLEKEGNCH